MPATRMRLFAGGPWAGQEKRITEPPPPTLRVPRSDGRAVYRFDRTTGMYGWHDPAELEWARRRVNEEDAERLAALEAAPPRVVTPNDGPAFDVLGLAPQHAHPGELEKGWPPLVVRDVGHRAGCPTITNQPGAVIRALRLRGELAVGMRLLYYDSEGQLDEIVWRPPYAFVAFRPGPRGGHAAGE